MFHFAFRCRADLAAVYGRQITGNDAPLLRRMWRQGDGIQKAQERFEDSKGMRKGALDLPEIVPVKMEIE